jgi:hypothetical protein
MTGSEKYFLPKEVSDKYRYSVSYIYFLVRTRQLSAARSGRQIPGFRKKKSAGDSAREPAIA